MLDLLFVGLTLLLWAIAWGLLTICDRLMESKP